MLSRFSTIHNCDGQADKRKPPVWLAREHAWLTRPAALVDCHLFSSEIRQTAHMSQHSILLQYMQLPLLLPLDAMHKRGQWHCAVSVRMSAGAEMTFHDLPQFFVRFHFNVLAGIVSSEVHSLPNSLEFPLWRCLQCLFSYTRWLAHQEVAQPSCHCSYNSCVCKSIFVNRSQSSCRTQYIGCCKWAT